MAASRNTETFIMQACLERFPTYFGSLSLLLHFMRSEIRSLSEFAIIHMYDPCDSNN